MINKLFCPQVTYSLQLSLIAILYLGCSTEVPKDQLSETPESGHQKMIKELRRISSETVDFHPFLKTSHIQLMRVQIKHSEKYGEKDHGYVLWKKYFDLGMAELRAGLLKDGVNRLQKAYDISMETDFSFDKKATESIGDAIDNNIYLRNKSRLALGIAFLRLGETENCCALNNAQSCIFPIQGSGIHTKTKGSESAINYFLEILEEKTDPNNYDEALNYKGSSKWLLNIAYMTLGQWPKEVPEEFLMELNINNYDGVFPQFTNIMPQLGLDNFNLCGGAIADDFDGDGDFDVVTSTWDTQGTMKFFRNHGDSTFIDDSTVSQLDQFLGGLNMVQADYDNDGDIDIFVLRGAWLGDDGKHPNSLLQNDGKGHFKDVTFESGLGDTQFPTKTAAWADYDNDGDLDLFVGNEATKKIVASCQLFQNDGNGHFVDVAMEVGLDDPIFAMGCSWGDYDNDRWPDLYITTGFSNPRYALDGGGPNRLYRNLQGKGFVDVAEKLNVTKPIAAFPTWFWDYNNDGNLDIYASCSSGPIGVLVTDIRFGLNKLYQGDGKGNFVDVASSMNLDYPSQPMGANFGDINGDGFQDFYLATGNIQYSELRPNIMFLNDQAKSFQNVTYAAGLGHLQKGHGVAFADFERDGDQDIYVQLGGAWPGDKYKDALFQNPGFKNKWISVKLVGNTSNKSAIGARIKVQILEEGKSRNIYKWVNSGGSFGGNPLEQYIGLGNADSIESLEIYWPTSDTTQRVIDLSFNKLLIIEEK